MRLTVTLTGTSPLLCHNIHLANPDNRWARAIAAITKKRTKTDDDRREIGRLEWFGSLYTHKNGIVMPTSNVLKCFIETGKVTKEGRSVARAVAMADVNVPLVYNGPDAPEELWNHEDFRDQTLVGVGKKRVLRTRPIFRAWALRVDMEMLTQVMDFEAIQKIIHLAGRIEGLGDNRVNGYGRFSAEILSHDEMKEAA
jgi:hypothetical protein